MRRDTNKSTNVALLGDIKTEPKLTRDARVTYWTRRHEIDHLEARIGLTDRGLDWLYRVKRIGLRT